MINKGIRIWSFLLALVLGFAPMAMAAESVEFTQTTYEGIAGFEFQVALKQPVGSDLPEDLQFRIKAKDAKVASVNATTGVVNPLRKGKIYLYAYSTSLGGVVGRTILDIKWNLADWKVYKNTKDAAIITPKRIYRHNGRTIGELWVYNKSYSAGIKRVLVKSGNLVVGLVDFTSNEDGVLIDSATIGASYKFPNKIYKGKAGVIKVEFKNVPGAPNFTTGDFAPYLINTSYYIHYKGPQNQGILFSAE